MSVYFIQTSRYFKVGYSDDAQRRFERLHLSGTRYTFPADAPWEVSERTLYKAIPGDKSSELAIHLALDDFAVGLEWFLDEPALREFIDALAVTGETQERYPKVEREGGWCAQEYREVQHGRGVRETARYMSRRAS